MAIIAKAIRLDGSEETLVPGGNVDLGALAIGEEWMIKIVLSDPHYDVSAGPPAPAARVTVTDVDGNTELPDGDTFENADIPAGRYEDTVQFKVKAAEAGTQNLSVTLEFTDLAAPHGDTQTFEITGNTPVAGGGAGGGTTATTTTAGGGAGNGGVTAHAEVHINHPTPPGTTQQNGSSSKWWWVGGGCLTLLLLAILAAVLLLILTVIGVPLIGAGAWAIQSGTAGTGIPTQTVPNGGGTITPGGGSTATTPPTTPRPFKKLPACTEIHEYDDVIVYMEKCDKDSSDPCCSQQTVAGSGNLAALPVSDWAAAFAGQNGLLLQFNGAGTSPVPSP